MFRIQKLDLLISIYILFVILSNVMGNKTFPLPDIGPIHLNASVSIFLIPLIFTINDMITEVFGKERTRSIIRSSLIVIFLTLVYSLLATSLPPSMRFAPMEDAYDTIFAVSAKFSAASLIPFASAEFLDVYVFAKIREMLGKKALWLRTNLSNFASQFIDTAVFMVLAFYALDLSFSENLSFILSLSIPYFLLRCVLSIIETPLVYLGVKWLKGEK